MSIIKSMIFTDDENSAALTVEFDTDTIPLVREGYISGVALARYDKHEQELFTIVGGKAISHMLDGHDVPQTDAAIRHLMVMSIIRQYRYFEHAADYAASDIGDAFNEEHYQVLNVD